MTKINGMVVSGYGGFYQVRLADASIINCKARGKLKKKFSKIYSGDKVEIMLLDDGSGMIEHINKRENSLPRPNVANIDRVVIMLSWDLPKYDLLLLDRMLVIAQSIGIEPIICINKIDLISDSKEDQEQFERIKNVYQNASFPVIAISTKQQRGLDPLMPYLQSGITVLAGQSGVGKSSLLNCLIPEHDAQVGEVSNRLRRGKHTTRYTSIIQIPGTEGFIADTPGFLVVDLPTSMTVKHLIGYYPDFLALEPCRFAACLHDREPDCAVKEAVKSGEIDKDRYQRYLRLKTEIQEQEEIYN